MLKITHILSAVLISFFVIDLPNAFSATSKSELYMPVKEVSLQQAQIVYYRPYSGAGQSNIAHVYVDGEFHNALQPGNFSTFCLAPGKHIIDSYINDAPEYLGKKNSKHAFDLRGGSIYFLRASEFNNSPPQLIDRITAERELVEVRRQVRFLSRASQVQKCDSPVTSSSVVPAK